MQGSPCQIPNKRDAPEKIIVIIIVIIMIEEQVNCREKTIIKTWIDKQNDNNNNDDDNSNNNNNNKLIHVYRWFLTWKDPTRL